MRVLRELVHGARVLSVVGHNGHAVEACAVNEVGHGVGSLVNGDPPHLEALLVGGVWQRPQ